MSEKNRVTRDKMWPVHYVKRADLRIDEILEQGQFWQQWISARYLYEECEDVQDLPPLNIHEESRLPDEEWQKMDPIEIIHFFCMCHRWKVYPPEWVLNELNYRFSDYISDNMRGEIRRLGEYFGEPANGNRSGKFRELARPSIEDACFHVDILEHWFSRPLNKALDIVSISYEEKQCDFLKSGKSGKIKGREALRKAHQQWRKNGRTLCMLEAWEEIPPTDEDRFSILKKIGHDALEGHPDLQSMLRKIKG